jgi:hypothetical protein
MEVDKNDWDARWFRTLQFLVSVFDGIMAELEGMIETT